MPSSYTYPIEETEDFSFEAFVMRCSRAMMPLFDMRDMPLDSPIPDQVLPDDYYLLKIEKLEKELAELEAMSMDDIKKKMDEELNEKMKDRQECKIRREAVNRRYEKMLEKVEADEIEQHQAHVNDQKGQQARRPPLEIDQQHGAAGQFFKNRGALVPGRLGRRPGGHHGEAPGCEAGVRPAHQLPGPADHSPIPDGQRHRETYHDHTGSLRPPAGSHGGGHPGALPRRGLLHGAGRGHVPVGKPAGGGVHYEGLRPGHRAEGRFRAG